MRARRRTVDDSFNGSTHLERLAADLSPFAPHPDDGTPSIDRVLVLAPTPFFGDRGCHVRIYEEVRALGRRGVQTEIVTYPSGRDLPGITIRRAPRISGVEASALGPGYSRPLLDLALIGTGMRAARRFRPQVLHAHLHEGIAVGAVIRRAFGTPLVADLQGSLSEELVDHDFLSPSGRAVRLMRRFERWLVNRPDALVASSATGATLLEAQGVPAERIEPLPDGVDLDAFRPTEKDPALVERFHLQGKQVVVFLGVLTEYQGVDALLAAVPQVVHRVPQAHFLILGYPNEERYREYVHATGLGAHVTLPGRVPYAEAARYLALGDVAISAKQSLTEANGKLLNYMACELPVVATDTPVNREILGDLGVFFPIGDAAALASSVADLLGDPPRLAQLGSALRLRAAGQFSWEAVTERLLSVYRRVARPATPQAHAARR
jgi:glycosyltransferase involved in cell wall biosynthesis